MRFACWKTKATDIHSDYVILIAFPRQQWLHERASIIRYKYMACIVCIFMGKYPVLRCFVYVADLRNVTPTLNRGRHLTHNEIFLHVKVCTCRGRLTFNALTPSLL